MNTVVSPRLTPHATPHVPPHLTPHVSPMNPTASSAVNSAVSATLPSPYARLAQSREQLRIALQGPTAAAAPGGGQRAASKTPAWLDALQSSPGVRIVIDAASQWWARHPLRAAATVATVAATAAVHPIAQRHPFGLVAGAAMFGGLVVWCRPWRWSKPALLAGVLPQLLLAAVRAVPLRHDRQRAP